MYLECEAFYKSYHNVASPEGVRLIRQGVWVLPKCLGFFFFIFASECLCKKTLQEQLHLPQRFYRQKLSVFVFRWIQGSDLRGR